MKEDKKMQRRAFLRTVTLGGVATAATLTSISPRKVFSQSKEEWRAINNWGQEPNDHMKLFAKMVSEGTEGLITIKFYGPGKIVPFPKTIEAVGDGTVEMGTGTPSFWKQKVPPMAYLHNTPFGLTAQEQNAWFAFGGGKRLLIKFTVKSVVSFSRSAILAARWVVGIIKRSIRLATLRALRFGWAASEVRP